jgi:15-cis-phytoene synthase
LWNLDLAFADVISTSSDARLGAIRLAWWRERLEELDQGEAPPPEPRLRAGASELMPLGVKGTELSCLDDAWQPLLEPFPWGRKQAEGMRLRGRILFEVGARLLGRVSRTVRDAGELWSLIDAAQHCSDPTSRRMLAQEASTVLASQHGRPPSRVRPLTILAALSAADLVREGSGFGRLSAAVRHRLFGTLPRS